MMRRGHIRQRGKTYSVVIELDRVGGKRKQKWVGGFADERAAEKALTAALAKLDKDEDPFSADLTLAAWAQCWLDHLRRNRKVRPVTLGSYERALRTHVLPALGGMRMRRIKVAHVQEVLDTMTEAGAASASVTRCRAVMSACFQQALRMDLLAVNVVRATTTPEEKSRKELRVPSGAELSAITHAARGTLWEIAVLLSATTAARRAEVLGLRWGNVDLDAGRARIVEGVQRIDGVIVRVPPKTKRGTRDVPLLPSVVARLRQYKVEQAQRLLALGVRQDDDTPVCDRGDGTPLDPCGYTHAAKKITAAAGCPGVRLHDLRHGVITTLAAEGNAPEVTSMMAGHATVGFTLTAYTHPKDDRLDEAVIRLQNALGE